MNGEESRSDAKNEEIREVESPENEAGTGEQDEGLEPGIQAKGSGAAKGTGKPADPEDEAEPSVDEPDEDDLDDEEEDEEVPFEVEVQDVEDREGWKKVTILIGQEVVHERITRTYEDLRREAHLPGFRPGRAPISVIRMRLGKTIRAELAQELIVGTLERAVEQLDFKTAGPPEFEPPLLEEQTPFSYEIRVESLPEVVLGTYRGLEVTRRRMPVSDEMVEQNLTQLVERRAEFTVAEDRPAQDGDFLVISLGAADQVTGETLFEPSDTEVTVGSGTTLPDTGFEPALVGLSVGESKTIPVEFAEDYQLGAFAGKSIDFKVNVQEIKCRSVPELGDEFAKEMGLDSLDELKEMTRERLEDAEEKRATEGLDREILEAVVEGSPFTPPASMVQRRMERLAGGELEKMDEETRGQIEGMAARSVKQELLLEKIAEVEKIEADDDRVDQLVALAAVNERIGKDELLEKWEESGQLDATRSQVRDEMVLELLREAARVTDETAAIDEPVDEADAADESADAEEE